MSEQLTFRQKPPAPRYSIGHALRVPTELDHLRNLDDCSCVSALPMLAMVVGTAAWNGVNVAVAVYLLMSIGGVLGLLAGFPAAFGQKTIYARITGVSALSIAVLAVVFGVGFILKRDRDLALGSPLYIAGVHAPLLVFYVVALVCCLVEAALSWNRVLQLRA